MWTSLAVTLALQAMIAVVQMTIPVLGPVLTSAAGVAPERIGILSSLTFAGSLWFLAVSGQLMRPFGAYRLLLLGNLLAAAGLLLFISQYWAVMMLGALLIGVGYGPTPPAGSQILGRATPAAMRGLVFSLKQSGVPFGAAVAGVLAPWIATRFGWQAAIAAIAALLLLTVAGAATLRARFADPVPPTARPRPRDLFAPKIALAPMRALRLGPALPRLAFASATFAAVQGGVFAFLVTYLVADTRLTLLAAGAAFAAMQGAGVVARIVMGWVADRIGSGLRTLTLLAAASATMVAALSLIAPGWPLWAIYMLCAAAGFAIASWNGVYLAEVVHAVAPDDIADATAGSTFFTFIGYVLSPLGFGFLVNLTGGYDLPFLALAVLVAVGGATLWTIRRPPGAH